MTREEASTHLFDDWYIENGRLCVDESNIDDFCKALGVGIKALRPISREQVEKVWRGEWEHTHSIDNLWTEVWVCSHCGFEDDNGDCFDFCPACGKAMTDEAVDIRLEELEALKDDLV